MNYNIFHLRWYRRLQRKNVEMSHSVVISFFYLLYCESLCTCVCVDDSDDDREVSRKRTVRQAASKAVSKQREILLGDGGSEDEEHEDQEEPYMDRMYNGTVKTCLHQMLHTSH